MYCTPRLVSYPSIICTLVIKLILMLSCALGNNVYNLLQDENLKVACRNTAYDGTSFDCDSCPPGYVGDGITCTDIDEVSFNYG